MKRLVAIAAAALLLAPAAPAFGKEELRALSVCGPVLCNIVRDTALIAELDGCSPPRRGRARRHSSRSTESTR